MALDEATYARLADATLKRLTDAIDDALGDRLDADLESGVLTLQLDSGGTYVINKQAPNRQIWLSSPVSGAWHFDYREAPGSAAPWVATRGGETLAALLSRELSLATGVALDLD